MAEKNFSLIVIGIVAIVAVVGLLNFNETTGKSVVQTATEEETFTTEWECTENGKYVCFEDWIETGKEGFTSDPWVCPEDKTKTCYHIYYRE